MNLAIYVETLREQLMAAAEMGGAEGKAFVDRLSAGVEAATRLVLLEAISAAADEITGELAPGAVELRLRGSNPEFVVTLPADAVREVAGDETTGPPTVLSQLDDDGGTSRLNLRLPESLKEKIEEAARQEGLSANAWLMRTAAAALDRPQGTMPRTPSGGQRFTGWVR